MIIIWSCQYSKKENSDTAYPALDHRGALRTVNTQVKLSYPNIFLCIYNLQYL